MEGFYVLTVMRTKYDVIFHCMESQVVINISEYRGAAIYSESEVQIFPKQLKQLTKLQYIITHKQ